MHFTLAARVSLLVCLFLTSTLVSAQQVYKCTNDDGSTTYSQLPCESDIGEEEVVDATPHQGHRVGPPPGTPAYTMPSQHRSTSRNARTQQMYGGESRPTLSRMERTALENDRLQALSNLRKSQLGLGKRSKYLRQLRDADRALGNTSADVAGMPEYDRRVYDRHGFQNPTSSRTPAPTHAPPPSPPRTPWMDPETGDWYNPAGPGSYMNSSTGEYWDERGGFLHGRESGNIKPFSGR